jgi:hypothetical protein
VPHIGTVKAMIVSKTPAVAAAILAVVAVAAGPAQAQIRMGTLSCDVSAGIGAIIASQKAVACAFVSTRGLREDYVGTITKVGVDIGVTTGGTIVWAVFAPTTEPGSLSGTYVGATAQATLAAGLGANILVGGSNQTVALQPISLSGQTGLNLAAGVGGLVLQRTR